MFSRGPTKPGRARFLAAAVAALAALASSGCASPAQQANGLLITAAADIDGGRDIPGGTELARKATQADPSSSSAWYWLGTGLFAQKRYSEAIPALRRTIDLGAVGDQYWSAAYTLGQSYAKTSELDAFKKLVESTNGVPAKTASSINSRGLLFLSVAMIGPAIQSFRAAVALDPGNTIYSQNLADAISRVDSIYGAAYRAHPDMKMLLFTQETAVEVGRWRNRMLVDAKDSLVPVLLRDSKAADLEALATKIEQAILDLTHETEMATERAERAEASAPGSGDGQRELALVYRERVALLKPILASVREEISNRQK